MNYGQRFVTLYRRQGSRPCPRKRNVKKQNGYVRRASHVAKKIRETKSKVKRTNGLIKSVISIVKTVGENKVLPFFNGI